MNKVRSTRGFDDAMSNAASRVGKVRHYSTGLSFRFNKNIHQSILSTFYLYSPSKYDIRRVIKIWPMKANRFRPEIEGSIMAQQRWCSDLET